MSTGIALNMRDIGVDLQQRGFFIAPLCHPDAAGQCACPRHHTGHNIGKAPLTPRGINDSSIEIRQTWDWWQRWPESNIAVDLDRSGLIVIAPDSPEWHQEFIRLGLPKTYTVQSGGGDGHVHYYYRRPANTPLINDNKPGQYDIQPRGYVVTEGSLHQSGRRYTCISDFPWRDVADLPPAPDWVLQRINERWNLAAANAPVEIVGDLPPVPLRLTTGRLSAWWAGSQVVELPDGTPDRSATLLAMARMMARAGATPAEIVAGLRDRDEALGYHKYSRRRDRGLKAYSSMAQVAARTLPAPRAASDSDPDGPDIIPQEPSDWPTPCGDEDSPYPDSLDDYNPARYQQTRNDEFQSLRAKIVAAYHVLGDHISAHKIAHCAVYLQGRLWGFSNKELLAYHCGRQACPTCAFARLHMLFMEKRDRLLALTMPTVYTARNVFAMLWPRDSDEQFAVLKTGHHACQGLLNRWSHRKDAPALVRNAVEALSSAIVETPDGRVITFGITLLANHIEGAERLLTQALTRRTPKLNDELAPYTFPVEGFKLEITEQVFCSSSLKDDLDGAIRRFQEIAAVPFQWDDPEDLGVWLKAMKHAKKVHGRGVLSEVSGNKPAGRTPSAGVNPETGEMDTYTMIPNQVWRRDVAEAYVSQADGRIHYRFKPGMENTPGFDPRQPPGGHPLA